jgi:hypothetical protein
MQHLAEKVMSIRKREKRPTGEPVATNRKIDKNLSNFRALTMLKSGTMCELEEFSLPIAQEEPTP